ncbi:MAG: hypothetical protein CVV10_03210 [Gammaproteobacteria bacterium HGW-Gammaproteobacteria-14]|nr:MAG: hypothetical protein CVV10_03210 [Gammaproteobacteria bacterium HGW-Gammaproteobacteria-14]
MKLPVNTASADHAQTDHGSATSGAILGSTKGSSLEELVHAVAERRADFADLIVALSPVISGATPLAPEMALQLSTALHEIDHTVIADHELYRLVNEQAAPALALNEAGQILALNSAAVQLFHLESGDGLKNLSISSAEFHSFKERLANIAGSTLIKVRRPQAAHGSLPLIMVGNYHFRHRAFLLVALQHHWPESIDRALQELFGLTSSERKTLSALAQGVSSEHIAEARGCAVSTIRQQIKMVLQKLGVHSQIQAASLAAAAANAVSTNAANTERLSLDYDDHPMQIHEFFRGHRRIGWRRFGKPGGTPVMWLHGPSFGAGDFPEERRLAEHHALDIFAIERPGYGRTHIPNANEDPLRCQCDDILALMDKQGITSALFICHEVALIPALSIACKQPQRISGIVAISAAPPFKQLQQIDAMPAHQGIFLMAARRAPWMARLMTRLLTIRMKKLGPEHWTDVVFEGVEPDHNIINRPELRQGVIASYGFYINQMGAGFEVDLRIMLKDWSTLITKTEVPVRLIHGERNATTRVEHLAIFHDLNPDITVDLVPEEGLTLAVSQPQRIFAAAIELLR